MNKIQSSNCCENNNLNKLEQIESLEQLRVLAHGEKISVYISHQAAAPGVDTPEDVAVVETYLKPHL